jgi:anti-sigma B factor antagonist
MGIDLERRPGGTLIRLDGTLDRYTAMELRQKVTQRVALGEIVVVDLSRHDDADSTALGILIGVLPRLAKNGEVRLVWAQPKIHRIFEITGLTRVFPIYQDVEAAFAGECGSQHPKGPGRKRATG